MPALQGEPGLSRVIERRRIERPEIGVGAAVLHVAIGAGTGDGPMHALLQSNPVRDLSVAGQAEVRSHLSVSPVATLAPARSVECSVGLRQGPGRRRLASLGASGGRSSRQGREPHRGKQHCARRGPPRAGRDHRHQCILRKCGHSTIAGVAVKALGRNPAGFQSGGGTGRQTNRGTDARAKIGSGGIVSSAIHVDRPACKQTTRQSGSSRVTARFANSPRSSRRIPAAKSSMFRGAAGDTRTGNVPDRRSVSGPGGALPVRFLHDP